ncbi:MAG: thiolase C-terminal domain-containing protein [Candidatus Kariarchaeaceae archaeon]|jgi:acetyl-CoA C-acetyltransferase
MDPIMDKVALIGYDMTEFGDLYQVGIADMASNAISGALKSAGVKREEIDGLYVGNAGAGQFLGQEHLGSLIATESGLDCQALRVEASGASGAVAMRVAAHGILTGYLDKVVVLGVEKMTSFSSSKDTQYALATGLDSIWEASMGGTLAGNFALMAKAHMRKNGTTLEQMAQVAVKNHENAKRNPRAQFRNLLRAESILKSKLVADPIRLLDGCAASDGAAALVMCNPEVAESYDNEPVYLRASKQGHAPLALHEREDISVLTAVKKAADNGYKQLGITPQDISIAEVHDIFTIAEIMAIEALGLVEEGKGGIATEEGTTSLTGGSPVNTSGGLKARGYPIGASGIAQAIEILDQFKGVGGDRQVKDLNWGLSQSLGGAGGTAVVNLYSR